MENEVSRQSLDLREDDSMGSVKIADDVVAMIAALAATEVDGVSSMNGNLTHEIMNKIGYKNVFVPSFLGISFITTGSSKSSTPSNFNPITRIIPAKIMPKYPPANDTKTFPVIAQIMPIAEKTIAVPNTKNNICTNVLKGFASEYPPT